VRDLAQAGLPDADVDALLLPRLADEEATAIACLIGQLGRRRFAGRFDGRRAEALLATLTSRTAVMRYEQALQLLADAGLAPADIESLAPSFVESRDDIQWLEALLRGSRGAGSPPGRLEVMHLRERCPEPASLYRYFRLRHALTHLSRLDADEASTLAFDAAGVELHALGLLMLLRLLERRGRTQSVGRETLRMLHTAFPTTDAVRRFERATANFVGEADMVDVLAIRHARCEETAAAMWLVGRFLADRGLNDPGRNPRLGAGLATLLANRMAERQAS
jgi:hypothetical protein